MDLVTFLITTYNSDKWIDQCIKSVINQTHKNLQIIIVDDGSVDNTVNIIKQFPDRRIELYCKEHSGLPKSLNYAKNKIKGKYIARLDSDDFCDNRRIEKQLNFLCKNEDYTIVGTNFVVINEKGKKILKVKNPEHDKWIKDQLPRRCCISHGTIMMKKSILLSNNGFDETRAYAEDWEFFLRVIAQSKFYNLQEDLNFVRTHKSNLSLSTFAKRESEVVLLNYNTKLIGSAISRIEKATGYFNIGYYYYYENNFISAHEYFEKALQNGGFNFQFIRYYIFNRYLSRFIRFYRKHRLYKLLDWLRYFDSSNKYLRNKF